MLRPLRALPHARVAHVLARSNPYAPMVHRLLTFFLPTLPACLVMGMPPRTPVSRTYAAAYRRLVPPLRPLARAPLQMRPQPVPVRHP